MALWGNTDDANSAPKYLSDADKAKTFFVDTTEAAVASNRAKGLKTGGWNLYSTYSTSEGTRHKAESLVAMSVAQADAGSDLGPTGNTTVEDTTVADT